MLKNNTLWFFLLLGLVVPGFASAADYTEGRHYLPLSQPMPTVLEEGQHEVIEFFWYGCPSCFQFEPHIEIWLDDKPDNVKFTRIPAIVGDPQPAPVWLAHARIYYALEAMGALPQAHSLLFDGIHEQGRRLNTVDAVARFLSQHGIDGEKLKTYTLSPEVSAKVSRARQLSQQHITGVPTVVIDGQFKTSARQAGGFGQILEVVDQLIAE